MPGYATGLTFEPEDADGLAEQVLRVIAEPDLGCRLAQSGRQTVLENFTLGQMVNEIEAYLMDCLRGVPGNRLTF